MSNRREGQSFITVDFVPAFDFEISTRNWLDFHSGEKEGGNINMYHIFDAAVGVGREFPRPALKLPRTLSLAIDRSHNMVRNYSTFLD